VFGSASLQTAWKQCFHTYTEAVKAVPSYTKHIVTAAELCLFFPDGGTFDEPYCYSIHDGSLRLLPAINTSSLVGWTPAVWWAGSVAQSLLVTLI